MKTKILITICIMFFSSIALFSQEKNVVKTVNKENQTEEFITYDSSNKKPLYKMVYQYNDDNERIKRNTYLFNNGEWVNSKQYEYIYNNDKKPLYIIYTKWNSKDKQWDSTSELLVHLYDRNGDFLSITKSQIDRNEFITAR